MEYAEMLTRGRINGNKEASAKDIYTMYVEKVVNDYEEHKLADTNPEFRNLMTEYRDGIMLFELMDRNVWTRAAKDSSGLEKFYEANKTKYQWEPGFSGVVYRFKDETAMKEGVKLLEAKKKLSNEELIKAMNTDSNPDAVTMQTGRYEFSKFSDAPREQLVAGKLTKAVKNSDGTYTVVRTDDVFSASSQKSLDDARGYVVAEYQDYLEKQWNANLRNKYEVKVDEKTFKSMVK
jgi:peptidyl-prolyl cis-trans isomerase SurA